MLGILMTALHKSYMYNGDLGKMKAGFAKKFTGATLEIKVRIQTAGCWMQAAGYMLLAACCWWLVVGCPLLAVNPHCYCWLANLLLIAVGCILSGVNSDVVSCKCVLQDEGGIPTIDIDVAQPRRTKRMASLKSQSHMSATCVAICI